MCLLLPPRAGGPFIDEMSSVVLLMCGWWWLSMDKVALHAGTVKVNTIAEQKQGMHTPRHDNRKKFAA